MSFFSKLRRSAPQADETLARAMLAPTVSAIMADGDMQAEEVSQLSNICSFSPVFHQIEPKRLADMVRELQAEIMDRGGDTVLKESVGAIPGHLRGTAYCFVVRIVLADGRTDSREQMALERFAKLLEIPPASVEEITRVISMLQRAP